MKYLFYSALSWLFADPRRTLAVLLIVMMALALTTAIVPNGIALAGDITSGS
ncbi:MAG: hypothetical protein GX573_04045 [Chloroflexi bacterium]|nr:hypothetical protein [Chloroflexota bacterium]